MGGNVIKVAPSSVTYDMIMRLCAGLTNLHVCFHPLRASDITVYKSYLNRLWDIGDNQARNHQEIQKRYREKRRRIMVV